VFRTEHCLKGSFGVWIGRRFAPGPFTGTTTGKYSGLALPVDSHFEHFEPFVSPHPLVAAPSMKIEQAAGLLPQLIVSQPSVQRGDRCSESNCDLSSRKHATALLIYR
jgi:hypothetical protein